MKKALYRDFINKCQGLACQTILADPPWQFKNRTGKVAPEHKRLSRYSTLTVKEIKAIPVSLATSANAHLYLWIPNALLHEGLSVMKAWGFEYKANLIWHKVRKDGEPDSRGVGFYFRNTTEIILFGIKGKMRTPTPARSQVNIIKSRKREHSRKPDEQYAIIEAVVQALILSYSREVPEKAGILGVTKLKITNHIGQPISIIAQLL